MSGYDAATLLWSAITAVATLAGTLTVVIAAIFGYGQLRETTRSRDLESMLSLLMHINGDDFRNAQRYVYSNTEDLAGHISNLKDWKAIDKYLRSSSSGRVDLNSFNSYLAALENVAILYMYNLAPDDAVEMFIKGMSLHHWKHLRPLVIDFRHRYLSNDFLQHFEMMVRCFHQDSNNGLPKRSRRRARKRHLLVQRKTEREKEIRTLFG